MENTPDSRPLLILDLDETLIFGSSTKLSAPSHYSIGPFFIYERPHLNEFIGSVKQYFDLAIWSSASHNYVLELANRIGNANRVNWIFVWSRWKCIQRMDPEWFETNYLKDLKKTKRFGYPLDRTLIVDDSPTKVSRHYGNAIYPSRFEGQTDDDELLQLSIYLIKIHRESNFRKIEKRNWRSQL